MSSSQNQQQTQDSKPQSEATHQPKTLETKSPIEESSDSDPPINGQPRTLANQEEEGSNVEGEGKEEEEEGECGFCLFMKAGGCKETFIAWEKCVEENEKNGEDIVEKCFEVTAALRKCMGEHSDYYGPLLEAEETMKEEAAKAMEKEKEEDKQAGVEGSNSESQLAVMSSEGLEEKEKEVMDETVKESS